VVGAKQRGADSLWLNRLFHLYPELNAAEAPVSVWPANANQATAKSTPGSQQHQ